VLAELAEDERERADLVKMRDLRELLPPERESIGRRIAELDLRIGARKKLIDDPDPAHPGGPVECRKRAILHHIVRLGFSATSLQPGAKAQIRAACEQDPTAFYTPPAFDKAWKPASERRQDRRR